MTVSRPGRRPYGLMLIAVLLVLIAGVALWGHARVLDPASCGARLAQAVARGEGLKPDHRQWRGCRGRPTGAGRP
jgi:hypothetical protein